MVQKVVSSVPILERPRLQGIFQQAIQDPLVYVEAGAGFGKSIALEQFITGKKGSSLLLRLKPVHNLSEAFWQDFIWNVSQINPAAARRFEKIGLPAEAAQVGAFIGQLRNIARNAPVHVVLDDFHVIHDSRIAAFISALVCARVPGLHLIIASRSPGVLDVGALEQKGLVARVGQQQLAFTGAEVAQLVSSRAGQATGLVQDVMEKTEGWPLAVHLLYCTMGPGKPLASSLEEIRPAVHNIMHNQLFAGYPEATRLALVRLSLFDTLHPGLAGQIPGAEEAIWEVVASGNPFLYQRKSGGYAIHHLYQEFLRFHTHLLAPGEAAGLYQSVGEWLYAGGHKFECIDCFRAAGDYRAVWQVIRETYEPMPSVSLRSFYSTLFSETPEEVIRADCHITLYAALMLICTDGIARARRLLDGLLNGTSCGAPGDDVRGECHLLYGLSCFIEGDLGFAFHWAKARRLLPGQSTLIDKGFRLMYFTPIFSPATLNEQDVGQVMDAYRQGLPDFSAATGGCGEGVLEGIRAELLYYQCKYDEAALYFELSRQKAERWHQYDVLANCAFYMVHTHIYRGEYAQCLNDIVFLRRFSIANPDGEVVSPLADYTLAYLDSLLNPEPFSIPAVIDLQRQEPVLSRGRHITTTMLTLMALPSGYRRALDYMEQSRPGMLEKGNFFTLCYVLILGSFCCVELGLSSLSWLLLEEAYSYSANGRYATMFIQNGRRTLKIIEHYGQNPRGKLPLAWLESTRAAAGQWVKNLAEMAAVYANRSPKS